MNTTRLLLLPDAPDSAATCLLIDSDGRVFGRQVATTAAPLDGRSVQPGRQVLAVPGSGCLVLWLDLPTRNPVQARAAARLLVEDHVAQPGTPLHVALAAPAPGSGNRLVVAVEEAALRAWLQRASALGMTPDIVVPMPLLLPLPLAGTADGDEADTGAIAIADIGGQWLVRGADLAFAAESALAERIIGERPLQALDAAVAEAAFAVNALSPPVDVLQDSFARPPPRSEGWQAWRRAAVMAALLAVSPLLLLASQAARYEFDARALRTRANADARSVLPDLAPGADALPPLRERLTGLRAGDGFARSVGALMAAVAAVDGAELDALAYADGELQATLVVAAPAELERVRAALAAAGLEMTETGNRGTSGRVHHAISVRPAA